MAQAPRKAVRAPWLMAYAYEDVLNRLEQRGFAPPRQRIGVRKARLAFAALRSLL
jgi:phytoene synthase